METKTTNITDRVKTFEDACKVLSLQEVTLSIELTKDEIAYKKLKIIAEALNEGWKPDWTNRKWDKYYSWFDMSSGSGLSLNVVYALISASLVGSRLCFKSKELAEYAATQFSELYHDYFII